MLMMIFYVIGMIVAVIIAVLLLYLEDDKSNLQYGMIAPIAFLSWIFVILALIHYRKRLWNSYIRPFVWHKYKDTYNIIKIVEV